MYGGRKDGDARIENSCKESGRTATRVTIEHQNVLAKAHLVHSYARGCLLCHAPEAARVQIIVRYMATQAVFLSTFTWGTKELAYRRRGRLHWR